MRTGLKTELGLSVSESPFQAALESVTRPLEFAARDNFAGAGRVRNLESTLAEACRKAGELAVPQDVRACLEAIRKLFLEPLGRGLPCCRGRAGVGTGRLNFFVEC